MKKRWISLFLTVCLVIGVLSAPAAAEEDRSGDGAVAVSPEMLPEPAEDPISETAGGEVGPFLWQTEAGAVSAVGENGSPFMAEVVSVTEVPEGYIGIYTPEDLMGIAGDLSGNYILMQDINLSGMNWTPIGDQDNPFTGSLDGNGHEISHMTINITDPNGEKVYVGMFGYGKPSMIKDLCISDLAIQVECTYGYIGGVIGFFDYGMGDRCIENCAVKSGTIKVNHSQSQSRIGGIVGYADYWSQILNCSNGAAIETEGVGYAYVGGIVGNCEGTADILGCTNFNSISVHIENASSTPAIGGILGYGITEVQNCANYGAISATHQKTDTQSTVASGAVNVGGIIGCGIKCSNCYNAADLSGVQTLTSTRDGARVVSAGVSVGGILGGKPNGRLTMLNCYNVGGVSGHASASAVSASQVEAEEYLGGIAGSIYTDSHDVTVENCYTLNTADNLFGSYSTESSTVLTNCRILSGGQMRNQESYAGFDFTSVWKMGSGSYPFPVFRGEEDLPGIEEPPEEETPVLIDISHYYGTTAMRNFRVYAMGAGYPAPVGFTIDVGGTQYTGYSDGDHVCDSIDIQVDPGYTGDVVITREGYYTQSIPAEYTGMLNYVTMVPTTVTDPFANALLLDKSAGDHGIYRNLFMDSETMYQRDLTDTEENLLSLCPMVEWNGHGAGTIWLEQGEIQVELTNHVFQQVDWSDYLFAAGETIYLCAEAADGTGFRYATNLKVIAPLHSGLEIDLGEGLTVDTSTSDEGDISIFAGKELTFDLSELSDDLIPMEISVKSDGSIQGTIGFTLGKASDKEAVFGTMKEALDNFEKTDEAKRKKIAALLDDLKQYGVPIERASTFGATGTVQMLGYFTGKQIDGEPKLTECKMALIFSGSLRYTYYTVVMTVPGYVEMSLGAKLETYIKMAYDETSGALSAGDGQKLDTSLSLSGELGAGLKGYLSGGVKGTGTLKISSVLPLTQRDTALSLRANLKIVGTLAGIDGEWVLCETPEMIFWDSGEWCWKDAADAEGQTYVFAPRLAAVSMKMANGEDTIVTGVSGYQAPALAILPDGRMLAVWAADVAGRRMVDNGGVYYSVCTDGVWSEPALVEDDGTNDAVPQLYQDGSTVFLAWQDYTTEFKTDTLPDYQTVSAQIETVVSVFDPDTDTWSAPEAGNPGWYDFAAGDDLPEDYEGEWPATDSTHQVLSAHGVRGVLYTAADEETGLSQVWGIFGDSAGWGEPIQLTRGGSGVNGFYAAMDDEKIAILYTSGDYADADLMLYEVPLDGNLTVTDADYVRQTLVPGHTLTLKTGVKNNSPVTVSGLSIQVSDSGGTTLLQEKVTTTIRPGEEKTVYVNYQLPEVIEDKELHIAVTPLLWRDTDESDNSAVCALELADLSVETFTAVAVGGETQAVVQVVNRGQADTQPAQLTFYRGSPDGEVLGNAQVDALGAGSLANIAVTLPGLDEGDLVYVAAEALPTENLIGNNTLHAMVAAVSRAETDLSAAVVRGEDTAAVTIRIDNRTTAAAESMTLVAAVYDGETGRQLDCALFEHVTVAALNSGEYRAELSAPAGVEELSWKVFCLDDNWAPLDEPLTGMSGSTSS